MPFRSRPGTRAGASLLLVLVLSSCFYGFTGGGLPSTVRTVFVEGFQNETPYAILTTDVQLALQRELPRDLGVRLASQAAADAVVRGKITGYEELTTNVRPGGQRGTVDVLQYQVQIRFDAEIHHVKEDRLLWRGTGLVAQGTYDPNRERVEQARGEAIEELVDKLIQGAQSQW